MPKRMIYGVEYSLASGEPTGRSEGYLAESPVEAAKSAHYTHSLKGPAAIGPSGRTVNYSGLSLVFPRS